MLKLKRVEIQGFKSFYDRTEMKFSGHGIAAVVGPNGCGKSNLSDAISWVLGEQSAKTLRGARMEDVIFAGTRDRKPLSMASVTMTLVPDERILIDAIEATPEVVSTPEESADVANTGAAPNVNGNGNGNGPIKTDAQKKAEPIGEITITRRLYRNGDSEYLINGKAARLRDIQDLFLGTGLGPESYAIIEQGRIGQILSNRPQDRRNVIEEAAGIAKFKTRKRLAEAKLESAKQNLSRVFDILEEVTRQANSLKRQAAKTKRYDELRGEATGYLRQVLAGKHRTLNELLNRTTIELNLVIGQLQAMQAAIAAHEGQQATLYATLQMVEQQLTETRNQLSALQVEAERARGRVEHQAKQIEQIGVRLISGEREITDIAGRREEAAAELAGVESLTAEMELRVAGARERLEKKASERSESQAILSEQERGLELFRQAVLRLLGESSSLKNRITQVETQLGSADRETARAKAEEQQSLADLERIQGTKKQISDRLGARQTELISVGDQKKEVEQQLGQQRTMLGGARQSVDRAKTEYSRVRARRESLDEVIQHHSYTTDAVKRLFTAVERGKTTGFKPSGVLADFLEVDPEFEKITEEFLHDELEYVVVHNVEQAERGIELMRGELNGRATFVVESVPNPQRPANDPPRPESSNHKLRDLTDVLRFSNGLSQMPGALLSRIANSYLAHDRSTALELSAQYPHCWFLSPEGVSFHGSAIAGGKKSGAGPLALKRELRELSQLEVVKQGELSTVQKQLTDLEGSITQLSEHLEVLRSRLQVQEKDVLALDHESRKLAEEFQRVQGRLSHARLELERLGRDRVRLEESVNHDRQLLGQVEANRNEKETALEQARDQLSTWQAHVARANEAHSALRAELAGVEERGRSLMASRDRSEARLRELDDRRTHLETQAQKLRTESAEYRASNEELMAVLEQLGHDRAVLEEQASALVARESGLRGKLQASDEQLKSLRQSAYAGQETRSTLQVTLAQAETNLSHLEQTCRQELDTSLSELQATTQAADRDFTDDVLADLEARYIEVRRKIEALGPVNPQALEEFAEAQERQEFLAAQRQDLLDSIRDTERAIHDIDGESRKRFGEAFHAINQNFREMFKTLFGGGIGEMRLTDEDNLSESGIDIVASPPGKRLQSVLLLSGGEKSMTAMALLMSIFQYTPSPFCILDEIDAPLDEPNIERLTKLLREMAEQTQFIVITHAKRTMEAAQSLYGVTMQEPGVSKLVSVKFKPQEEVDRNRTAVEATRERELAAAATA